MSAETGCLEALAGFRERYGQEPNPALVNYRCVSEVLVDPTVTLVGTTPLVPRYSVPQAISQNGESSPLPALLAAPGDPEDLLAASQHLSEPSAEPDTTDPGRCPC